MNILRTAEIATMKTACTSLRKASTSGEAAVIISMMIRCLSSYGKDSPCKELREQVIETWRYFKKERDLTNEDRAMIDILINAVSNYLSSM